MVETLLSQYRRSFSLCNACDHACHVELDMPPPGSENTILRTRHLLCGAEREQIGQSIARTDECLQEIGAKVKDLMALVARLHEGERELKALRSVQQAYLAPVRKLPPEILSIIFKMCCGVESVDLLQEQCPPLILSSVCKAWRDTMLGLQSAWNHFEFSTYGTVATSRLASTITRLRAFLDYSGDLPLRHCVKYDLSPFAARNAKREQPLKLLIEHAHRWTDVQIESRSELSEGERARLGKLEGQRLSRLQSLDGYVDVFAACSAMGLFEGLTSLRSITLRGFLYNLRRDTVIALPWDNIEEMETLLPCEYALLYLQRCPNLAAWTYSDVSRFGAQETSLPDSFVVLPRLRTVFVRFSHASDTAVLHRITAPALQEGKLIFTSGWHDPNSDIGFSALLERSSCPLRCLTLEYAPRSVMDALHSDALRGLTFLSVRASDDAPLTRAFIDLLGTPDSAGKPRLLPLLEGLEIGGEPEGFKATALVRMAKARRKMGYPLKRFVLDAVLLGMSSYTFGWSNKIEYKMAKVVDSVDVRGRHNIRSLSPSP